MANRNPQEPKRENPGQGQSVNPNRPDQNRSERGGEQRSGQGQTGNPNRPGEEENRGRQQNR